MNDFQGQIDFMKNKFREMVTKVDDTLEKFRSFQASQDYANQFFADIRKNQNDLKTQHDALFDKAETRNINLDSHIKSLIQLTGLSDTAFKELKSQQEGLKNDLAKLASDHQDTKNAQAQFLKSDSVEPLKAYLNQVVENQNNANASLKAGHNLLTDNMIELRASASKQNSVLVDLQKKALEQGENHTALSKRLDCQTEMNHRYCDSMFQDLKDLLDKKIAEIPKPIIPSLEDAKASFAKQLEPISMDARNSHSRSYNNEMKITILEKKVEQLTLALKKIELGG